MKSKAIKKSTTLTLLIVALLIVLSVALAFFITRRNAEVEADRLDTLQQNMLEELSARKGDYNEKKIVLSGTSHSNAEQLAEVIGAKLRITADGSFATLTLTDDRTIQDIVSNDEYKKYLESFGIDYAANVSDLYIEDEDNSYRNPAMPNGGYASEDELGDYLGFVNVGNVWYHYKGDGVTVAVIDTGIDTDHPEFAGRISEYSYNATEDKIVKDYVLENGEYDWSLVEDVQGHGTAVAGTLGASMDGVGMTGIAPNVTIIVIKAECDEQGRFESTSDLVFGLYYAIERDVNVVNMSFGTISNVFAEAAQLAYDSDIICVAAAGNEATASLTYPAADKNVIGVGALADGWQLASYSNYGENSDVVAPGSTYTTVIGGGYRMSLGTSLSSPVVAGAIALFKQNNYYSTFDQITDLLYASSYDLGSVGNDWEYGFGALDVSAFLLEERGTVTFDMLADELENTKALFIRGHALQELPEPERLYSVFDGWYYDDSFTEEVDYYSDVFESDLTLYAKWVNEEDGVPYTYFVLEDGTVEIRSYTGHRRYITVPDRIDGRAVSSIGDLAFYGQEKLREVKLPEGLTGIGASAFEQCGNLISIEIPESVTSIGKRAFYNNTRLASVAFVGNSRLEAVGAEAFSYCGKIEKIELPAMLESIDGSAFLGNISMHTVSVQKENHVYRSVDGILFDSAGTTVVVYPAARTISYDLPEDVRMIGDYAFAYSRLKALDLKQIEKIGEFAFYASQLEHITIPDSVTEIERGTFIININLESVHIGGGLSSIPEEAFLGCSSLEDITIPSGIQTIERNAFSFCGLERVSFEESSTLKVIGERSFYRVYIREIDIPASVETIGESAFDFSENDRFFNPLTRVGFAENSKLVSIGERAFACSYNLKNIELPIKLENIGAKAFIDSGITAVTVPASVTSLGDGAFARCLFLSSVEVEDANAVYTDIDGVVYNSEKTEIYSYPAGRENDAYTLESTVEVIMPWTFAGANHLDNVYLPDSLTQICEYAFAYCRSLGGLLIPDNVLQIGEYAFCDTPELQTIEFNPTAKLPRISYRAFAYSGLVSLTVPASVSTIARGAFEGCGNMISIAFAEGSRLESISAYMLDGCKRLQSITFPNSGSLKSIQAHGFEGLDNLTYIDFGDARITNIDNFAFRFCTDLQSISIPDTVTNIGRYAFYGCTSLLEIIIPESIEHVGSYAFLGTNGINVYFASATLPRYLDENWDKDTKGYYVGVTSVAEDGDYKYATLTSGDISIIQYRGDDTHIDLTKLDFGAPITAIGGSAFKDSTVKSVILPDTLTSIQAEAFKYSSLENITVPAGVTFIGREAFAYTTISSLMFEDDSQLYRIEQYAFQHTKSLDSVNLPASLTEMGSGAFMESGLNRLVFEDGIRLSEIPQKAFASTRIAEVIIPDSVTLVNHSAFNNVTNLKRVTFGKGENLRLMSKAFYNTGIDSLYIPENVTFIGEYCFVALSNLKEFIVAENNPNYTSIDGLLLTENGRKLIAVPAGREGSLTVPASVEEIGFGAFEASKLSDVLFLPDANILTFGYRAFYNANSITAITVPATVVSIDYYAFGYCENLTTVVFAEGSQLKGIYEGAFIGDDNLANITIPDTVVEISDFAFFGCRKITEIPTSDNSELKGIYDYAFAYSGIHGEFTTPETLTDIGDYAFMGTEIVKLIIPDANSKILTVGIGAFEDCDYLTEVTLPFIGASFEDSKLSWFGYIFGAGAPEAGVAYVPASLKTVTVTEGITTLFPHSFAYCPNIETINLPHSISVVWELAFGHITTAAHEFTNVITVKSGGPHIDSIDSSDLGAGLYGDLILAESNMTSIFMPSSEYLQSIVVPEGITEINFTFCTGLRAVHLPDSMVKINDDAFRGCSGLVEIILPSSLIEIGRDAFYECTSLVRVVNNSSLELELGSESNGYVVRYAKSLVNKDGSSVCIGDFEYIETSDGFRFVKQDGVYKLIAYMGDADTVTLPEDVMGCEYELYRFTGASRVIIPDGVTEIGANAFRDSGIVDIELPDSLISIGDDAFSGCRTLRQIELPYGLESIGIGAFYSCQALTEVKIPHTVTYLGGGAFNSCYSLVRANIPDGVTELIGTFAYCHSLKYVNIPESVKLMSGTFNECRALTDIKIPEGVTHIHQSTFALCDSLDTLKLPVGLEYIDGTAFSFNTDVIFEGNEHFRIIDGILYSADLTRLIYVTKSVSLSIVIPDTVVHISQNAFEGRDGLESIALPDGMTEIPYGLFKDCKNLTYVDIPDSVTEILGGAFSGCSGIVSIDLPVGLKRIDFAAFAGCTSLTSIKFPDGLESIGRNAFSGSGLASIVIPDSVAELDTAVFSECENLTDVTLPDGIRSVSAMMFMGCCALENIKLPDTVTSIDTQAFEGCSSLSLITITESVTFIGDRAFIGCVKLYEVVNNSLLNLEFDSWDNGWVTYYAKVVTDRDGTVTYRDPENKFTYIDTPDGFRYMYDGEYKLLAYLGDEENITLPESINGNPYKLYHFKGGVNVIIPDGVEEIPYYAFAYNKTLRTVTIPDSVTTIAQEAFLHCISLAEISIPSSVTSVGSGAFYGCTNIAAIEILSTNADFECGFSETAYSRDSSNWKNGMLVIDGYIFDVDESLHYLTNLEGIIGVASGAYDGCYYLKNPVFSSIYSAEKATNADTYVITDVRNISQWEAIQNTLTLKNVIILDTVDASDLRYCEELFTYGNVTGITIFVEGYEHDLRWDDNFPGWNNGNVVFYADEWIYADFYDVDGNLISHSPKRTSEIIRRPIVDIVDDEKYDYEFIGWDLNGDGKQDSLTATSVVNISAKPVILKALQKYTVIFKDSETGEIYYQEVMEYGSEIVPPVISSEEEGVVLQGWNGYTEGMTVTEDIVFVTDWHKHSMAMYRVLTSAFCNQTGIDEYKCLGCSFTETRVSNALGHDIVQHKAKTPICTEIGWNEYVTCSRCDYSTYVELPANGHSYGEWIEIKTPGTETTGAESRYCETCNHCETREIAPLGYVQEFIDAVDDLSGKQSAEITYGELYSALVLYSKLSEDEKQQVSDSFTVLQLAIEDYNDDAKLVNKELANATEVAFAPITVSFAFLAALWLLLEKKFMF